MNSMKYDVVVIGGGVIGCAVARELSRYQLKTCVVEREEDVCSGTSKANSAIVHGGFDAEPGSLKAKFNIQGSRMMEELSEELDFEYKRNGSLVLCFAEEDKPALQALYEKGMQNGVEGMSVISGDEARKMEPNIEDTVVAALNVPSGGIVCPFGLNIALAENAATNGVEFHFNTEVTDICRKDDGYQLSTNRGYILTRCVVNAAGVYADVFHNMVSEHKLHITARKGEYCLLDKTTGGLVDKTIFQLPGKYGKGIINNSKTKIILNLEDEEAIRVQNILHLSEAETMAITHFERGNGLISTNNNNVTVEFKASELEKELITTDREELKRLLEREKHRHHLPDAG